MNTSYFHILHVSVQITLYFLYFVNEL